MSYPCRAAKTHTHSEKSHICLVCEPQIFQTLTGPYSNRFGKSAPDNDSLSTATTSRCSTTSSTLFGRLYWIYRESEFTLSLRAKILATHYFSTHGCGILIRSVGFLAPDDGPAEPTVIFPVFKNACILFATNFASTFDIQKFRLWCCICNRKKRCACVHAMNKMMRRNCLIWREPTEHVHCSYKTHAGNVDSFALKDTHLLLTINLLRIFGIQSNDCEKCGVS